MIAAEEPKLKPIIVKAITPLRPCGEALAGSLPVGLRSHESESHECDNKRTKN